MSNTVIQVSNLSKLYRLGEVGTGTISHDLNRWWSSVRGKEDPFAKVGTVNDRTQKAEKGEHVWALRDINFEVEQGEVLGIIGKNGAGKSTLLKLLSRVTSPTTGEIKAKGRIASLLEVGTGFNPEMTGRENIYMNGTILGMRRKEITAKLDDIVDFAGVAKYLDTPSKRYSSGMTVRLGFAVAAFLEPEILIVDEVLAVGDAEFQKRAIGKMQDISKGGGRTVLFVSHNMASIKLLCQRCILLNNGTIDADGDTENVLDQYLIVNENNIENNIALRTDRTGTGEAKFIEFELQTKNKKTNNVLINQKICFLMKIESRKILENVDIVLSIYNNYGILLTSTSTKFTKRSSITLFKGENNLKCLFNSLPFQVGKYYINTSININDKPIDLIERVYSFDVIENDIYGTGKINFGSKSLIHLPNEWQI